LKFAGQQHPDLTRSPGNYDLHLFSSTKRSDGKPRAKAPEDAEQKQIADLSKSSGQPIRNLQEPVRILQRKTP
jgi:hypothetical protein